MDHPERSCVNRHGKLAAAGPAARAPTGAREGAREAVPAVIRRASPADLDQLLHLETVFPGDRLSRRAMRRHLASPRAVWLVAEVESRLVGYALLLRRRGTRWWRLYSLMRAGVAPAGTGRRLLEAAIEAAREGGAQGIRLEVREENAAAIRLYRACGFSLFAALDGYYEDGARALRMVLDLSA
jgi:ribosomal-protein-alanine N-acetyltransferase